MRTIALFIGLTLMLSGCAVDHQYMNCINGHDQIAGVSDLPVFVCDEYRPSGLPPPSRSN
jgi:hypothetical protein